jgi:tRNA dimethylallyltransferase
LSAGRFVTLADRAITDVIARGRTAVVVGGTGLYLRALRVGLDEARPVDPALRNRLKDDLRTQGLAALVERLRALRRGDGGDVHDAEGERNDGDAAAGDLGDLDVKNPMRVLRALELALSNTAVAARDANAFLARPPRPGVQGARWLLVSRSPGVLANRIAARTRAMFATGTIVDEARALAAVLPADHPLLATIGIAEALAVARGTLETGGAIAQTATRTRQYARRQRTWFRKEPWWTPLADDAGDAGDEDVLAAAVAALDREDSACAGDACTGNASMLEGCAVNGRGGQR